MTEIRFITISAVDKEGCLLLTEEEWLARLKLRDDTGESNRPSSRIGGKEAVEISPAHARERGGSKEGGVD